MIIDQSLNAQVNANIIAENEARNEEHISSGKLSASMLYQPLRFQVLKTIGAPRRPMDVYTLGKFSRGYQCEDWFTDQLKKVGLLVEAQKDVEYRGCVGKADTTIDTDKMHCKKGIIPNEIKSVNNAKLKRIQSTEVDYHYRLQACMYAMAMDVKHYAITVISGEDLQRYLYIYGIDDGYIKDDVNKLIKAYDEAMKKWETDRVLPPFAVHPKVTWTNNPDYAMFDMKWATDGYAMEELSKLGLIK